MQTYIGHRYIHVCVLRKFLRNCAIDDLSQRRHCGKSHEVKLEKQEDERERYLERGGKSDRTNDIKAKKIHVCIRRCKKTRVHSKMQQNRAYQRVLR